MKTLLIMMSILSTTATFAADRQAAYDVICKEQRMYQEECFKTVKEFEFYQNEALELCAGFIQNHHKIKCLSHIGDKAYSTYELHHCGSIRYSVERLKCLKENGSYGN